MAQKSTLPANTVVSLSAVVAGINTGKRAVDVNSILMVIPFGDNLRPSDFPLKDHIRDDLISSKKVLSFESAILLLGRDAAGYSHGRKPAFRSDVHKDYISLCTAVLEKTKFNGKALNHEGLASAICDAVNNLAVTKKAEKPLPAKKTEIALPHKEAGDRISEFMKRQQEEHAARNLRKLENWAENHGYQMDNAAARHLDDIANVESARAAAAARQLEESARAAAAAAAAREADLPALAIEFCRLADKFGIKLTAKQLEKLPAAA